MKRFLIISYNRYSKLCRKYSVYENYRKIYHTDSKYELKVKLGLLGLKLGKFVNDNERCSHFKDNLGLNVELNER